MLTYSSARNFAKNRRLLKHKWQIMCMIWEEICRQRRRKTRTKKSIRKRTPLSHGETSQELWLIRFIIEAIFFFSPSPSCTLTSKKPWFFSLVSSSDCVYHGCGPWSHEKLIRLLPREQKKKVHFPFQSPINLVLRYVTISYYLLKTYLANIKI